MRFVHAAVAIAAMCAVYILGYAVANVSTEEKPLFVKGQQIAVIWDCAPAYAAKAVSQVLAGGQPLAPCYGEALQVETVHKNGWIDVKDSSGEAWTVNPSRMLGFTSIEDPKNLRAFNQGGASWSAVHSSPSLSH